ncbi:hypothetical protein [Brevundimonas sp.]|uniref:hypothetical protein n=1 Tax=Brevundimonas sp. TaxID=1871086 RepID=UPI00261F21F4|nr:hypothetical protein [Brevundimonas sp.]
MTKAPPEVPANYYLLSDETWALIVEDYANGAMAKEVAAKWRVGPNSVYRHASAAGLTKRECGDERARAHAEAVTQAAWARDDPPGPATTGPTLTALFAPPPEEDPDAGDPGALARAAILASGRAMKGRLWAEAKALAGLAESYARLGDRMVGEFESDRPSPQDAAALAYVLERLEAEDREAERRGEIEREAGA